MADIARGTFLPIATGERIFTKWGFREILEKRAASILQPDLCHAGGITEVPPDRGHGRGLLRRPSRRTIRWDRFRWPRASIWRPRFPISCARSKSAWAKAISRRRLRSRTATFDLPTGPGLGIELDETALADKIDHDWREPRSLRSRRRLGNGLVAVTAQGRLHFLPAVKSQSQSPAEAGQGFQPDGPFSCFSPTVTHLRSRAD